MSFKLTTSTHSSADGSVQVAVAVIVGDDGRLLISRRADHLHQGGLWEFPGGKLEAGETVQQALARELEEELGIGVVDSAPLIRIPFRYPDKQVLLDVHRVLAFDGEPRGREGQPLQWVAIHDLDARQFPAANGAIIDALKLPDRYAISGSFVDPDDFLSKLQRCLSGGVSMMQLRLGALDDRLALNLLRSGSVMCRRYGARAIGNGPLRLLSEVDLDGVHLNGRQLAALSVDDLLPWQGKWIGASCHNLAQVEQALSLGSRYLSLSPVLTTGSHPQAAVLGWERFSTLVDEVPVPVFALGGMNQTLISEAVACGAQGIAAISAFWPQ